jgi:hypothetical protein
LAVIVKIECTHLKYLFLLLSSTGRANYGVVDSGWDGRDDKKGVKARPHILDMGGASEDGVVVIL